MFFKVGLKNKTKKNQRMGLRYLRRSAIMGRLFAPGQGSSNKNANDLCHGGHRQQKTPKYGDFHG